jgi:hypothetical protein
MGTAQTQRQFEALLDILDFVEMADSVVIKKAAANTVAFPKGEWRIPTLVESLLDLLEVNRNLVVSRYQRVGKRVVRYVRKVEPSDESDTPNKPPPTKYCFAVPYFH